MQCTMVDGELKSLLNIFATVAASMAYAHFISARLPSGCRRLLALLPVISILPALPWSLSSIHLRLISFFFLTWLATFKLLLLSFDLGPLSPSLPLPTFIAIASLPLNLRPPGKSPPQPPHRLLTIVKAVILAAVISINRHHRRIDPYLLFAIHPVHLYIAMEFILLFTATATRALLGLDLEPQFDNPYLAVSLSDFWGRRWNLMVTAVLHPAVYRPVRARWGPAAGVMAAFLVSGLMHELLLYYLTLTRPTGEITAYFVLHGACVVGEAKARMAGWRPPPQALAVVLTVGFVMLTGFLLFYPPLVRSGMAERVAEECGVLVEFLERCGRALIDWLVLQTHPIHKLVP